MGTRTPAHTIKRDERSGVYTVRFRWAGQRYHRTTGRSDLGEAQAEAARIVASVVERGRAPMKRGGAPPMVDLLGAWIADYEAGHAAATTKEMERYAASLFVPSFPTLRDVTEANLAAYATSRLRAVKAATVKKELSALAQFLSWARQRGVILEPPRLPELPRRALGTPNAKRAQIRVDLTPEQAEAFLAELPEASRKGKHTGAPYPVRDVFRLMWETGLRIGTVARLETPRHWRHGGRDLTITDDIDKARYGRTIPVSDVARDILDRHTKRKRDGVIFGDYDCRGLLHAAALRIGLPDDLARRLGPHDFRHAAITHLANSGAPLTSVALLVGHKTITMTARYVHADIQAAEQAIRIRAGHTGGTRGDFRGTVPVSSGRRKRP